MLTLKNSVWHLSLPFEQSYCGIKFFLNKFSITVIASLLLNSNGTKKNVLVQQNENTNEPK